MKDIGDRKLILDPVDHRSKNGTGPKSMLASLSGHYTEVSKEYANAGMAFEKELFEGVAEDLRGILKRIEEAMK